MPSGLTSEDFVHYQNPTGCEEEPERTLRTVFPFEPAPFWTTLYTKEGLVIVSNEADSFIWPYHVGLVRTVESAQIQQLKTQTRQAEIKAELAQKEAAELRERAELAEKARLEFEAKVGQLRAARAEARVEELQEAQQQLVTSVVGRQLKSPDSHSGR